MTTMLIGVFIFLVIVPQKAHAYLDPGNGSYLFQLALGSILGIVITLRLYSKKIFSFVGEFFKSKKTPKQE